MKQYFVLLLTTGLLSASCNSQDIPRSKVPAVVLNALQAQFPNAAEVDWEKHGSVYEAEIDVPGGADITVQIDAAGKLLRQKQDVPLSQLPTSLQALLQSQYRKFRVDDVEKIEKGSTVYYQVELDGKGLNSLRDKHLVFSADGREDKDTTYWR